MFQAEESILKRFRSERGHDIKELKVAWNAQRVETTRKRTKDEVREISRARWLKGLVTISSLGSVNSYSVNYGDSQVW